MQFSTQQPRVPTQAHVFQTALPLQNTKPEGTSASGWSGTSPPASSPALRRVEDEVNTNLPCPQKTAPIQHLWGGSILPFPSLGAVRQPLPAPPTLQRRGSVFFT